MSENPSRYGGITCAAGQNVPFCFTQYKLTACDAPVCRTCCNRRSFVNICVEWSQSKALVRRRRKSFSVSAVALTAVSSQPWIADHAVVKLSHHAKEQGVEASKRIPGQKQQLHKDRQGESRKGFAICISRSTSEKARYAVSVDSAHKRRDQTTWSTMPRAIFFAHLKPSCECFQFLPNITG